MEDAHYIHRVISDSIENRIVVDGYNVVINLKTESKACWKMGKAEYAANDTRSCLLRKLNAVASNVRFDLCNIGLSSARYDHLMNHMVC